MNYTLRKIGWMHSALARSSRSSAISVAVAAFVILLAPPPPAQLWESLCVSVRSATDHHTIVQNCDSYLFVDMAERPRLLFENDGRVWQSRPLFPVLGWGFALAVGAGKSALRAFGADPGPSLDPYYFGYIVLNLMLLTMSLILFLRLVSYEGRLNAALALPIVILLLNDVTKAFLWTPHLQIFNILTPLVGIGFSMWISGRLGQVGWDAIVAIGFGLGVCALAYGSFIVVIGTGAVAVVATSQRGQWKRILLRISVLLGAFTAPIFGWMTFVIWETGAFYSHELRYYRQFVWLGHAALGGWQRLSNEVSSNILAFLATFPASLAFPLFLLAISIAAAALLRIPIRTGGNRRLYHGIITYYLVALPFYALMGYYASRLTWALVPPILLALGATLLQINAHVAGLQRRLMQAGLIVGAIVYAIYTVTKAGPYS